MSTQGLPYGLSAMLKEGHRHYSGLEEAVYKNIDACKQLAAIVKTSMGPNGERESGFALELFVTLIALFGLIDR